MMCHDVTRLLPLYLDSELSPETSFAIAEHLEVCPTCDARAENERGLELSIRSRLLVPEPEDTAAWDTATGGVRRGLARSPVRRVALVAAAAVAVVLLATLAPWTHRELDMARSAAADHGRFITEVAEEDVPSATLDQLEVVTTRTLHGSLQVPAALPAGYQLVKVGQCTLDGAPVAYVILTGGGEPVSLFLMDRSELSRFPGAAARLAKEPTGVACDVKGRAFFLTGAADRLACGVGKLDGAELERLVRWLLSG